MGGEAIVLSNDTVHGDVYWGLTSHCAAAWRCSVVNATAARSCDLSGHVTFFRNTDVTLYVFLVPGLHIVGPFADVHYPVSFEALDFQPSHSEFQIISTKSTYEHSNHTTYIAQNLHSRDNT